MRRIVFCSPVRRTQGGLPPFDRNTPIIRTTMVGSTYEHHILIVVLIIATVSAIAIVIIITKRVCYMRYFSAPENRAEISFQYGHIGLLRHTLGTILPLKQISFSLFTAYAALLFRDGIIIAGRVYG